MRNDKDAHELGEEISIDCHPQIDSVLHDASNKFWLNIANLI